MKKEVSNKKTYYIVTGVIIVSLVIGLLVYFLVIKNNDTTTVTYGNNFLVTYESNYLNSSEEIKNSYREHISGATQFWNNILLEDTVINITVKTISEARSGEYITLAQAIPFSSDNLKGGGIMWINTQASPHNWTDVIKHEIGHIMGIGSNEYWHDAIIEEDNALNGTKFPISLSAYKDLYGGPVGATSIPLTNTYGHWNEEIFDKELMTPISDAPHRQPVTLLTLGALLNMGWNVDLEQAESK